MVKFTAEELRKIMDMQQSIRNMSVIGHVDHGKSPIPDSHAAAAGIIAQKAAGDVRKADTQAVRQIPQSVTLHSNLLISQKDKGMSTSSTL